MKIYIKITALLLSVLFFAAPLFSCANNPPAPVTEPMTEPVTEPATEPITEPVTEPVTEPATEPATEPITEPVTEPATDPVTEPMTEPVTEPATEPTTEPATEPITEPATEPATEPITEPATEPVTEPAKTPEELQAERLKELLYLTDDGYVKIKGSDNIKLSKDGFYVYYDNAPKVKYFLSNSFSTTENLSSVPSYYGTSSPHSYTFEEGKLTVIYNDGEKTLSFEGEISATDYTKNEQLTFDFSSLNIRDPYVSPEVTTFIGSIGRANGCVLIVIYNSGESVEFIYQKTSFGAFRMNANGVGYGLDGEMRLAAGTENYLMLRTDNGGRTFDFSHKIFAWISEQPFHNSPSLTFINNKLFTIGGLYIDSWYSETFPEEIVAASLGDLSRLGRGLYNTGSYSQYEPYFDGDIGVMAVKMSLFINGESNKRYNKQGYFYFISLDGGSTWTEYDPANFSSASETLEIEYTVEPSPKER